MKSNALKGAIAIFLVVLFVYVFCYQAFWNWVVCRWEVDKGESIQITSKFGDTAPSNAYSDGKTQQGVIEQMRGPGRHFINPISQSVIRVPDLVVDPGQIVIVKNKLGKDLPPGRFIANPGEKGTVKQVLTPGTWRINPYGQEVEANELAKVIKPGYVGVQTLREGDNKGILEEVLTPGIYPINSRERRVDEMEIGYTFWSSWYEEKPGQITDPKTKQVMEVMVPVDGTGIQFPLKDGKDMFLDITVIWGLFPEEAPRAIREYGSHEMVVSKVIEPQVESICKNLGSNFTTMHFIQSETRLKFQTEFTAELKKMGEEKGLHIKVALVRRFGPDPTIRTTIQETLLAEEEKRTLEVELMRDRKAAELEQSQKMVDVAITDFDSETTKLFEAERELGQKKAAEIKAGADRQVADLENQEATIQAQIIEMMGQAEADVTEASRLADAKSYELQVKAFGGAEIHNKTKFAQALPDDLSVDFQYAGEGTLWTDAGKNVEEVAAKKILEQATRQQKPATSAKGVLMPNVNQTSAPVGPAPEEGDAAKADPSA